MAFWNNLFDKREKMAYREGCSNFFNLALVIDFQYLQEYQDIAEVYYRADIVGIVAAYLDTKPHERYMRTTFGKDVLHYGTVRGTVLIDTHPIARTLKSVFLPKCEQKHAHYSKFMQSEMNNSINGTTTRTLASEVLRVNGIPVDSAKINSIAVDINMILEWVNTTLSTYRFE